LKHCFAIFLVIIDQRKCMHKLLDPSRSARWYISVQFSRNHYSLLAYAS
jgi:hypothetical protein